MNKLLDINHLKKNYHDIKKETIALSDISFDVYDNESYTKCVIEYISGMTDQFAIEVYGEIISF